MIDRTEAIVYYKYKENNNQSQYRKNMIDRTEAIVYYELKRRATTNHNTGEI